MSRVIKITNPDFQLAKALADKLMHRGAFPRSFFVDPNTWPLIQDLQGWELVDIAAVKAQIAAESSSLQATQPGITAAEMEEAESMLRTYSGENKFVLDVQRRFTQYKRLTPKQAFAVVKAIRAEYAQNGAANVQG